MPTDKAIKTVEAVIGSGFAIMDNPNSDFVLVSTPHLFGDGDHMSLAVSQLPDDRWLLTDAGDTIGHYWLEGLIDDTIDDCHRAILEDLLSEHRPWAESLTLDDDELRMTVRSDRLKHSIHLFAQMMITLSTVCQVEIFGRRR